MKMIAAVAVLNAVLLVLGPLAIGSGRALFVEQSRHVPVICMDWLPVMIGAAGDFRNVHEDIECRPAEVTFGRSFEE